MKFAYHLIVWAIGIAAAILIGIVLNSMTVPQPENYMLVLMFLWTLYRGGLVLMAMRRVVRG